MLWLSQNEKSTGGGVDPIDGWGEGGKKDEDKGYKEYKRPRVKKMYFYITNKTQTNMSCGTWMLNLSLYWMLNLG